MKRKRLAIPGYLNMSISFVSMERMNETVSDAKTFNFIWRSFRFDLENNALVIHVQEGRELHVPGKGRGDPYIKTYILPDPKKATKRKLSIKAKSTDPVWAEEIRYPITNVEVCNAHVN